MADIKQGKASERVNHRGETIDEEQRSFIEKQNENTNHESANQGMDGVNAMMSGYQTQAVEDGKMEYIKSAPGVNINKLRSIGHRYTSTGMMYQYSLMANSNAGPTLHALQDINTIVTVAKNSAGNLVSSVAMLEMTEDQYKEAVVHFRNAGYGNISGDPLHRTTMVNTILRKNKDVLSDQDILLLKQMRNYQQGMAMKHPGGKRQIFAMVKSKTLRQIRQTDAGRSIAIMVSISDQLQRILKRAVKLARNARHASKIVYEKSVLAGLRVAIANAEQKLKEGKSISKIEDTLLSTSKTAKHAKLKAKERAETRKKIKKKIFDPFGIRKKISKGVRVFVHKVPFGKVVVKVAQKVAAFMHILNVAIGGVYILALALLLAVILAFSTQIFQMVNSQYDLANQDDEKIVTEALQALQQCYLDQSNMISNMDDGSYTDGVVVKYETEKNQDVYDEILANFDQDEDSYTYNNFKAALNANCNIPEILSMAYIYFDYDLEDAGKDAVIDYVKRLYNGSNLISIDEKEWTETITKSRTVTLPDGTSKKETYTEEEFHNKATVTVTTYYFDDIFQCSLMDSVGQLAGNTVTEQVWSYFTSAGFSEEATAAILGNMYQESGVKPASIQGGGKGPAAGILQWENYNTKSGRWKELDKYAKSKGTDWTDLQTQLDFIVKKDMAKQFKAYTGHGVHVYSTGAVAWWPTKVTVSQYKSMTDIEKATEIWERVFTRASKPNMNRRITAAKRYYEKYHGMTFSNASYENSNVNGTGVARILNAAKYVSEIGQNNKWTYKSTAKGEHSLQEMIESKHTSCANYVCAILQEAGYLKKGRTFWSSANGQTHWSASTEAEIRKNFDVIHVNYDKNFKLQAGDVVLFSNGLQHTALYAGKVNGQKMWYDGGRGSTKDHRAGSVFTNFYRTSSVNANKRIRVVFRLKG